MQIRIVYTSLLNTTNVQTRYIEGSYQSVTFGGSTFENRALDKRTALRALDTPPAALAALEVSDAELAAIFVAMNTMWTSKSVIDGDFGLGFGILSVGVMPDGSNFIEFDMALFIDRTFDEWQWYVDNNPTSPDLPAGFSAGWMARRADVHSAKNLPPNIAVQIETPQSVAPAADEHIDVDYNEFGIYYIYGFPTLIDAWFYEIPSEQLLATDANMTSEIDTSGSYPRERYTYRFGAAAATQFWTNFRACVEDV